VYVSTDDVRALFTLPTAAQRRPIWKRLSAHDRIAEPMRDDSCAGLTIGHMAASKGRLDILKAWCDHGGHVSTRSYLPAGFGRGKTVAGIAAEHGHHEILEWCLTRSMSESDEPFGVSHVVHGIIIHGSTQGLDIWMRHGGPIDLRTHAGETMGHAMAGYGRRDMLKMWYDHGGDALAVCDVGRSIGHAICQGYRSHPDVVTGMMTDWCAAGGSWDMRITHGPRSGVSVGASTIESPAHDALMSMWVASGGDVHETDSYGHTMPQYIFQSHIVLPTTRRQDRLISWMKHGGLIAHVPDPYIRRSVLNLPHPHPRIRVQQVWLRNERSMGSRCSPEEREAFRTDDGRATAEALVPFIADPIRLARWLMHIGDAQPASSGR
jgi:hypothetical protein